MNSYPTTCRAGAHSRQRASLEERRILRFNEVWRPGSKGASSITCIAGRCWITRAGDPEDYLLEPGRCFSARSRDGVVVQSLADGTVLLVEGPLRDE